ncbi:transposase [Litoribacillus peritrichatus]|uniref:transposase n=1 Tax=Litoribacillus peritrichatus TaxID=718191 RepID=UPI0031D3A1FD
MLVCDDEGLLGKELLAIDGCKMSSNAAKEWSGTFQEFSEKHQKIKRQIKHHLREHQREDQATEDRDARQQRAEQAIETLNKAADKIEQFLKEAEPRKGQGKRKSEVKSNITDNESGKMTTSKGTIQGFNGVATVDKKHQIVVDAQAFGEGQEHHTLEPVLESIKDRFNRLEISADIYKTGMIVTVDTGFANESNMKYLHENSSNGYIPDNQFRSRDPKFTDQKTKYGKRKQHLRKTKLAELILASEFNFDPVNQICVCPAGNQISHRDEREDGNGNTKVYFEGRLSQCKNCDIKHQCMKNPESANHRKGSGRQVSFILENKRAPNYTDWMKHRVDSAKGKQIYSHRMSVVEPVFGNIGTNKGLNRFSLRGKEKVTGQWQLFCLVHNIEKLCNYGQLAA